MLAYNTKCSLQPRNTNLAKLSCDILDLAGLIMRPALLKTLSLAAELAGTVNSFLASGVTQANFLSLKMRRPLVAMSSSDVGSEYCFFTSVADLQ
jgi:hypothetical protein